MVKQWIFLFLWLPIVLFSAEFTASVNRNPVNSGETFTLNLILKDASAQGSPSLDDLKTLFLIHSQQHSSNIVMTNGRITSSTTWKIALTSQKEGEMIIPPIKIHTSEGILSSQPINIHVVKGNANSSETDEMTLTADVSKANPYKNEPIFYHVKLTSKLDLVNIKIEKFNIEDAIIEPNGEPKAYQTMMNGVKLNVIELSYLITPLKAGALKIPSLAIQGQIPIRNQSYMGSPFDDDFDPFFLMSGFNRLKPFMLTTQEKILDVQPAIVGMIPWLPAQSLAIEEIWNDAQTLKEGEPIIRSFKVIAKGIQSHQLPSLNEQQIVDHEFKVYADKPEMGDEIKNGNVYSFRQEQYTLIPQKSGTLTLPEISMTWWDVTKQEKALTHLPSRTLQILPNPENTQNHPSNPEEKTSALTSTDASVVNQKNTFLYFLIAGLAVLLLAGFFWVVALQKKIRRLTEPSTEIKSAKLSEKPRPMVYSNIKQKPPAKDKKEKLPDLNPT